MQQPEQIKMMSTEVETSADVSSERNLVDSSVEIAMESSLPKKPRRYLNCFSNFSIIQLLPW